MKRVLIVEDEPNMVKGLRNTLELQGYAVTAAADGERGLVLARDPGLDLVILDIMLPGMDGIELCRRLRAERVHTPVIMLTARGRDEDKVEGLEVGADDYVTKPFSIAELLARVKAILRRSGMDQAPPEAFEFAGKRIDFAERCLVDGRRKLPLSHYELEILRLLVSPPGQVVPRVRFIQEIWGDAYLPTSRTVDYHVVNLRRKIEPRTSQPRHIVTVHGVGYVFQE